MNCEGSDDNCTEGFFCNDMDACQANLCVQNDVRCGDNGVCLPSSGQCSSAESCTSSADCVEGELCVSQEGQSGEGVCTPEENACGDADGDGGCPGNQTCEYNESELAAICAEPEVCQTSRDCKDGRQCGGRTCLAQVSCQSDALEPNNTPEEATTFTDVAQNLLVSGSLCQGDTDEFTFTTTDIVTPTTTGTIVVSINVPERDIGLGTVSATLSDSQGNTEDTASLSMMADDGTMRMTTSLGIPEHGTYSVSIEPGGQMSSAGLNYEMTVNVVPQGAVQACESPRVITPGQRLSGDTNNDSVSGVSATCMEDEATSSAAVYALQIDESRDVTITAEPTTSEGDAVVSLRTRCLARGSERACSNADGGGGSEAISAVLGAGTHYVLVQSAGDSPLGSFTLKVDSQFTTTCGPEDSYCSDGQTAEICSPDGGRYSSVSCDNGCQPSTGLCVPLAGNTCVDAPTISPDTGNMDGGNGGGDMNGDGDMQENPTVTREFDLRQLSNDYGIQPGGCLDSEPRTDGPERVFEVELPAKTSVTVDATFEGGVVGSLYFTDACAGLESSCVTGAQDSVDDAPSEETLSYSNTTEQSETRYLVVDTETARNVGNATVTMTFKDVICTPEMKRCGPSSNVETCNEFGTARNITDDCKSWGCMSATCQRPDTCMSAINATSAARASGGASYSGEWANFSDDISDSPCTDSSIGSIDTDGNESVYQLDMQANDVLQATLSGNGDFSPYLKPAADCGTSDTSCLDWIELEGGAASVSYQSSSSQTVNLIAEREAESSGSFTVDVSLQQPVPACQNSTYSPTCDGSGNLKYCSTQYPIFDTYSCTGGCMNGTCGTPTGAIPQDAKPVSNGDSEGNSYSGSNAVDPVGNNATGSCNFGEDTAGADWTYKVDLQANETLTADYNGNSCCDIMYLLKDYTDTSTCVESVDNDGSITYTAGNSPETVYVVMDHDSYTSNSSWNYTVDFTVN